MYDNNITLKMSLLPRQKQLREIFSWDEVRETIPLLKFGIKKLFNHFEDSN